MLWYRATNTKTETPATKEKRRSSSSFSMLSRALATEESEPLTPATQASSIVVAIERLEGVEGLYTSENFLEDDKGIAVEECESFSEQDDVSSIASSSCQEDLEDSLLGLEQELLDLEVDLLDSYEGMRDRSVFGLEKDITVPRRRRFCTSFLADLENAGTEEEILDTDSYRLACKRGIPVWKGRSCEDKKQDEGLTVLLPPEILTIVVPLGTSGSEMAEYFSGRKRIAGGNIQE